MKKKSYALILTALIVITLILSFSSCDFFPEKVEINNQTENIISPPFLSARVGSVGFNDVSFTINKTIVRNNVTYTYDVVSITLMEGNVVVAQAKSPSIASFSNLKEGTAYVIVIKYTCSASEEIQQLNLRFTTKERKRPTFDVFDYTVSPTSIKASLSITDDDNLLNHYNLDLYDGDLLVATRDDGVISFDGLEPMKEYTLKIRATLNRRDGRGDVEEILFERKIKVPPNVGVSDITLLSADKLLPSDDAILEIKLDNPHGVNVRGVVINGTSYAVEPSADTDTVTVKFNNTSMIYSGDTLLSVEALNAKHESYVYTAATASDGVRVYFIAPPSIASIELVDENLEPTYWVFPSNEIYVLITTKNATGATIESATERNELAVRTDITRIDDTRWLLKLSDRNVGEWNFFALSSIKYTDQDTTGIINGLEKFELSYLALTSDEIHYVTTAQDLKDMNRGYYYELTGDIDLSGINWYGNKFNGVFDGKGYSIKNMSFIGELQNQSLYLGLFTRGSGIITNLVIEGATISVNSKASRVECGTYCGALVGYATDLTLINCAVDGASSIKAIGSNVSTITCGGLVGGGRVRIVDSSNAANVTSGIYAGGLVGSGNVTIINSYNVGTVSISPSSSQICVGGLVGRGYGTVTSSFNAGSITVTKNYQLFVGGIFGETTDATVITKAHNSGKIDFNSDEWNNGRYGCGGLVGYVSADLTVSESYNEGEITFAVKSAYFACAGGIIGMISANDCAITVENCYNKGALQMEERSSNVTTCAGIVAQCCSGTTVIRNCYNIGSILGISNNNNLMIAAGILGLAESSEVSVISCLNASSSLAVEYDYSHYRPVDSIVGYSITNGLNIQCCYSVRLFSLQNGVTLCDISALNYLKFYTGTLGWSAEVWDFSNLNTYDGRYPTLK